MAENTYTQAINKALSSAKSMLGKNEVPNREDIQSYLHDGGQDLDSHKLAWCAAFVSASLQKAGLPIPTQVVKDSAFGPGAYAGNYLTYGSSVDPKNIQAGDVLVANNGSHVGFAEGPIRQGPNGPEVQLLAGNEKDASGQYAPGSYTNPKTGAVANRSQVGMVGERWVPLSEYRARRYQAPDDTSQPAAAPQPSGTTITSAPVPTSGAPVGALAAPANNVFETMRQNIGQFESGGDYHILGPKLKSGDYAIGRYQVMASNVPSWTEKWFGTKMTPDQFRASPEAQEAVFKGEFGSYLDAGTPGDAASRWFTGRPLSEGANRKDILGTSGAKYAAIATKGLDSDAVTTRGPSRPMTPTPASAGPAYAAPSAAAPAADKPLWQRIFDAPVDAQGNPTGAKSPLAQAADAFGGSGKDKGSSLQQFKQAQEDEAPEGTVKNQAGQAPGARNVSPMGGALLPNVPQTYGQTINSLATPLTWNSAPPRAPQMPASGFQGPMGPQVPGMSLMSFQAPQGIGYGVDPNIGYGYA